MCARLWLGVFRTAVQSAHSDQQAERKQVGPDLEGVDVEEPGALTETDGRPGETVKRTVVVDDSNIRGYLKAVDPMTGKSKWETPYQSPNYSSTMVTASDLVFTGGSTSRW
jgi:alcohol dehydrogenase (cytochrome c)